MKFNLQYPFILIFFLFSSCGGGNEKLNIFSIEDDLKPGVQMDQFILSDSSGLEILDSVKYSYAYSRINHIKNYILSSENIKHKNEFVWEVKIIKNDTVLNAFATPGGYIYIFTGLIKYLDNEDELAGVMSHEIAHADRRHSTHMLTKAYGINLLLNIILGNDNQQISNITQSLVSLKFSRDAEQDADRHSVIYLCQENSLYKADGAARFFDKMLQEENKGYMPEFLSKHPSSPNRIKHIEKVFQELKCQNSGHSNFDYIQLKKSLP